MASYEKYMTDRLKEEESGSITMYNNIRLTKEVQELKNRIKQLETDMAYNTYATSPEEQRIYDLRKTD